MIAEEAIEILRKKAPQLIHSREYMHYFRPDDGKLLDEAIYLSHELNSNLYGPYFVSLFRSSKTKLLDTVKKLRKEYELRKGELLAKKLHVI